MRLRRLYQPRNPLFWLLLALNALNSVLVVILNTQPLQFGLLLLIASFAIANAVLGMLVAWWLVKTP